MYGKILSKVLIASNYAGIAFNNAGVGAVHALSYPLGSIFHVPHGEANYQFFTEILKIYLNKKPDGKIKEFVNLFSRYLSQNNFNSGENFCDELESFLNKIIEKKALSSYGLKQEEILNISENIIKNQQRLLANNYAELSVSEIAEIYNKLL